MDLAQYKDLFISEAQEHLQALSQAILDLEQTPAGDEPMERSLRAAHTIKGMAATMGYEELGHLAHATEDLMDRVRKRAIPATPDLVDLLFQALDALESQLTAIAEEKSPAMDPGEMIAALRAFQPSAHVTDVSGRGVGMDVVLRQVESMRGHLEIESQVGHGTRFSLRLPLTLAIVQALLVRVAQETYAVPLSHVHRTVEVFPGQVRVVEGQPVAALPEELFSLYSLAALVGLPHPDLPARRDPEDPIYALVVERDGQHLGLVVDELLGHEEIVIKSLSGFLGRIPGLAGATVLGEGEVVLILDVVNLLS